MSVQPKNDVSPGEYLERERRADHKSEYYAGEVFAMSGGSRRHSLIATNLASELRTALKGTGCLVFNSDLRVYVAASGLYTYPDVSVVCGDERYVDEEEDTLTTPVVIVEVLSPATETYDRGQKFTFYRGLASLREYVLVAQERRSVEVFRRNDAGRWELYEPDPEHGTVELASVGCVLRLDEVYANVRFDGGGFRTGSPSGA